MEKKVKSKKPNEIKIPEEMKNSFLAKQLKLTPDQIVGMIVGSYREAGENIRRIQECNY